MPPRQADTPAISTEKIAVMRGNRLILNGFSLEAVSGDIIWIRGVNGSGKSTLLRVLAGLLPVASGRVDVSGAVAFADDNPALDGNRTLEHALAFWADLDETSPAQREAALAAYDLIALAEVPMRYLSAGQKRRAGLARVHASRAPIWLLDEPYNGLDSANVARLDAELLRHAAAGGIALVAAHQPPSINVANSIKLGGSSK